MSEALEKLQKLGAQKIYEDTHIPIKHVQAILHESFEGFSKVQFLGFISILEKEYSLELQELHEKGAEYFVEKNISTEGDSLFISQQKRVKKSKKILYIVSIVVLFVVVFLWNFSQVHSAVENEFLVDNSIIESVAESISEEKNSTLVVVEELPDEKIERLAESEPLVAEEAQIEENGSVASLKIVAQKKVWFGYIDMQSDKHYQKVLKGAIELDPKKDWLLVFGHGYIDVFLDGKAVKFKTYNNTHFIYKDGHFDALTRKEFKRFNRGRKW